MPARSAVSGFIKIQSQRLSNLGLLPLPSGTSQVVEETQKDQIVMEKALENGQNPDVGETTRAASPPYPDKVTWTPDEEKSLLRRIDFRILPGLSLLYLLCFLDRT